MKQLSALEMAAAVVLAKQVSPDGSHAFIEQLKTAEVSGREFTGVGFYTEFSVNRALPPAVVTVSPGGWVRSEVGPEAYPLEFILYVKDGYAEMIEAYSYFDGYGDIDLLTASFTARVDSGHQLQCRSLTSASEHVASCSSAESYRRGGGFRRRGL